MDPPLQAAYDDAKNRTIKEYHRLTSVNAIRYAISLNRPVVFGIPVYQAFEESQDGHVPMPLPSDQPLGGHAIQCIGYYTDANTPGGGLFVLLNSWGERAGDHGRYYIPWEYMTALGWSEAWSMTVG
jgi:C1A family cysteine protease